MTPSIAQNKGMSWVWALAIAGLYLFGLNEPPLFDVDEGAFAEASREMLASADWWNTTLNGLDRFDKPIGVYWLQALSLAIWGPHEFAVRLPSALTVGWALLLVTVAPWYVYALNRHGMAFVDGFFLKHNVERFTGTLEGHGGSLLNYLLVLPLLLLPWSPLIWKVLRTVKSHWADPLQRYLTIWFAFVWTFFSLSGTKLPHYMLYGVAPLVIDGSFSVRVLWSGWSVSMLWITATVPWLRNTLQDPFKNVAMWAKQQQLSLVQWRMHLPSLAFYLEQPSPQRMPLPHEHVVVKLGREAGLEGQYQIVHEHRGLKIMKRLPEKAQ